MYAVLVLPPPKGYSRTVAGWLAKAYSRLNEHSRLKESVGLQGLQPAVSSKANYSPAPRTEPAVKDKGLAKRNYNVPRKGVEETEREEMKELEAVS